MSLGSRPTARCALQARGLTLDVAPPCAGSLGHPIWQMDRAAFGVEGVAQAFAGEAQNDGAIDQAVHSGHGGLFGWEEGSPFRETRVGRDHDGALLMTGTDDAEEAVGGDGVEGAGVSEFVEQEHLRLDVAAQRPGKGVISAAEA